LHPECTIVLDEAAASQLNGADSYLRAFENRLEQSIFRAAAASINKDNLQTGRQLGDNRQFLAYTPAESQ